MAEGNGTTRCSDDHCRRYSILNKLNNPPSHHMVLSDDLSGDLLDATQFCEAFFHVPEVHINYQGRWYNTNMQCFDRKNCRVFDQHHRLNTKTNTPERRQPKHVVCLVVLKRGQNVEYKAIYENCVRECNRKHAEEFFDDDARNGNLKEILDGYLTEVTGNMDINRDSSQTARRQDSPSESNDLKLCMYITLQPCHYSTTNYSTQDKPPKSCTNTLIKLYRDRLKPLGIEFVVKPTFIYKAYWSSWKTTEEKQQIDNAKKGLKMLFKEGIKIEAMMKDDWKFLKDKLRPASVELFPGRSYQRSERKKLHDFIDDFLDGIKESASTSDSASSSSGSASSPSGSNLETETPERNKKEYGNLTSNLKIDLKYPNKKLLKWNGTKVELKQFLSLFSENEDLGEIRETQNNDPNVNARFRGTEGSIFVLYKTNTLLCQGIQHDENKAKLSNLI